MTKNINDIIVRMMIHCVVKASDPLRLMFDSRAMIFFPVYLNHSGFYYKNMPYPSYSVCMIYIP